ncbi:vegetative cell wall protein gp1-like [Pipra filicauda]|uniref:Vegetative cell wall protein gp1-like n=1 Tax=Pipra filicauda TaxID=649802 RepID=A0A7R5L591_9PASS|nr:vegetative cell wall protein gp1-like [Pipra filicauda]
MDPALCQVPGPPWEGPCPVPGSGTSPGGTLVPRSHLLFPEPSLGESPRGSIQSSPEATGPRWSVASPPPRPPSRCSSRDRCPGTGTGFEPARVANSPRCTSGDPGNPGNPGMASREAPELREQPLHLPGPSPGGPSHPPGAPSPAHPEGPGAGIQSPGPAPWHPRGPSAVHPPPCTPSLPPDPHPALHPQNLPCQPCRAPSCQPATLGPQILPPAPLLALPPFCYLCSPNPSPPGALPLSSWFCPPNPSLPCAPPPSCCLCPPNPPPSCTLPPSQPLHPQIHPAAPLAWPVPPACATTLPLCLGSGIPGTLQAQGPAGTSGTGKDSPIPCATLACQHSRCHRCSRVPALAPRVPVPAPAASQCPHPCAVPNPAWTRSPAQPEARLPARCCFSSSVPGEASPAHPGMPASIPLLCIPAGMPRAGHAACRARHSPPWHRPTSFPGCRDGE